MRVRDKNSKLLEEWNLYCKNLQALTPAQNIHETDKEKKERTECLLKDYEAFVEYYFFAITRGTKSARFHIQTANKIAKNPKARFILEWARGHAKSTHISLFIVLWLVAKGEIKNFMLVSYSYDMACALLGKIQAHLATNPRWMNDFGEQVKIGSWAEGEFTTREGVHFTCRGAGQSPRGASSDDSYRPDYIVIDDIDEDELVENPKRVRKMLKWVLTALFGAMDMGRGRFIMVGNRIHKNSILANLAKNKAFQHSIVNALDKEGNPSWGEKYTKEEIEQVGLEIGDINFQREYMNNPVIEGTIFKPAQIIFTTPPKLNDMDDMVMYIDPSFKNTATSDYKACVLVGKKGGKFYILAVFNRKTSLTVMIKWLYDRYGKMSEIAQTISRWYSEANFTQGDLVGEELYSEGEERGYQLPMHFDTRQKPNKEQRIESIAFLFERGLIFWSEKIKNHTDVELAIEHLLAFERGTRTPDDFPDALEGAIFKLQQYHSSNNTKSEARIGRVENDFSY
jgi:predicted phage terminase large subunit-like protein